MPPGSATVVAPQGSRAASPTLVIVRKPLGRYTREIDERVFQITEKYEAYRAWGQEAVLPQDETFDLPFDRLLRERFVIGTPG